MARRSPESLADYLAVAVCPALIMLLVGSLVFFLIEVFYQGQYGGRLLFVMAMFVMAIVAIARISIEQDVGYATLYAIPLAGVVLLAMSYFVTIEGPLASVSMLVNASFMAIVWWSAHKLTWDCTLIDDSQDASGKGLLQEMGLDLAADGQSGPVERQAAAPGSSAHRDELEAVTHTEAQTERPWFERWLVSDRRPHAPGVWIIYFSLAALPLFGFGGWFVPAGDSAARARVFQWLVVYVGSGLGLLLATSFLGLRRYLRQRRLEMPLEMTAVWTGLGLALIFGTLLVSAVLPRPRAEYSLTQLPVVFTSAVRRASSLAMRHEGTEDQSNQQAAKAEAKRGQQAEPDGQGKSKNGDPSGATGDSGKSGSSKGEGKSNDQRQGKSQTGDSKQSGQDSHEQKNGGEAKGAKSSNDRQEGKSEGGTSKRSEKSQPDESQNKSADDSSTSEEQAQPPERRSSELAESNEQTPQSERSSPSSRSISQTASNLLQGVGTLFRFLCYLALAIAAVILGWVYRAQLLEAWNKLLAELRELWATWFGRKTPGAEVAAQEEPRAPPRPFSSYPDPFANGAARRMSWLELVQYTFEASEAWAREHNAPRTVDQTPHEFAIALGRIEPQVGSGIQKLAAWYSQVAYAPRSASAGSADSLQQLWRALSSAPAAPPVLTPPHR